MKDLPWPRNAISAAADAFAQAADLVQFEFKLARAEVREKAAALQAGLILVVAGAVLITAALFLVLQTIVVGLVQAGMDPWLATLLVAIACIVVGGALVLSGRKRLDPAGLVPERTLGDLSRDSALVKEKLT
jgi:Putative Actinobacterial Holin-X, holin superfamily III